MTFQNEDKIDSKTDSRILGLIVPKGVETGTVNALYESKRGDIYEVEALVNFREKEITKIKGKIVHHGPFIKRLPQKIFIIIFVLGSGLILNYFFAIRFIYYLIGMLSFLIFDEILIILQNKRYEKSHSDIGISTVMEK